MYAKVNPVWTRDFSVSFRPVMLWIVLALLFAPAPAQANSIIVNTTTDGPPANDGLCTLREAITNANGNNSAGSPDCAAGSGTDIITFSVTGAIVLSSAFPVITDNLTITGPSITISGANAFSIFNVTSGVTLILNTLTISNGLSAGGDGGAIFNSGTLNINNCKFLNNQTGTAWSGGAIVTYGPLNITNSEFANNIAGNGGAIYPRFAAAVATITGSSLHDNQTANTTNGWGGAMLLWDGAHVTITQSSLYNNIALKGGGAIYVQGTSNLTIDNSQIYSNNTTALVAEGGSIRSEGVLSVTSSTWHQNHASTNGGAIFVASGTANVAGSTFTNNFARYGGAIYQSSGNLTLTQDSFYHNGYSIDGSLITLYGGAIDHAGGTAQLNNLTMSYNFGSNGGAINQESGDITLINVTISGNDSTQGHGINQTGGATTVINSTLYGNVGFFDTGGVWSQGGTISLRNTIVANSSGAKNCYKPIAVNMFSLSSDNSCGFGLGRDNVNVKLSALGNHGGPTQTHVPLPGSPAIDFGTGVGCPSTDQRGKPRPIGLACDVGAAERQLVDVNYLLYLPVVVR